MRNRRVTETVGLSFLDAIFCGFGAIILLFVLSKAGQPLALEQDLAELTKIVRELEEQNEKIRGQTHVLNRELVSAKTQVAEEKKHVARLQGDLTSVQGEYQASRDLAVEQNQLAGHLASARQKLTEEMRRLQAITPPTRRKTASAVGGIPVDSEYIIFIIDTSGSMRNYAWPLVRKKMAETLAIYPHVKGIQVMNDMGSYMFSQYAGKWIPDSPARRRSILAQLSNWNAFSNSSPVEGIKAAIKTFYSKDKKISLYVFGDEFSGGSIDTVVRTVDRLNRADSKGRKRVRIHAVGFPVMFSQQGSAQSTGIRFATLMRILTERNGGAFVALNSFKR